MSVKPLLSADNVYVELQKRKILRGISLCLCKGELLGLLGPNGAGKSTLMKALAQLLPYRGEIRCMGRSLQQVPAIERARLIAYLEQSVQKGWPIKVHDYVALGRLPHRSTWYRNMHRDHDSKAVKIAIEQVGLGSLDDRPVVELSGGEFARVRLARALAVQTPLLLADEPVSVLDPFHQLQVMELLRRLCCDGRAGIVVLHDLTLASRFCDRLLLLDKGRTVASGIPRQVLTPVNLQQVYQVQAMVGEHQQQSYILPWSCYSTESSSEEKYR
ncbi:MAG: ABC transporter ATP-binding protein [Gammaproteobacteria bacterium]|nr:ABC transporter ATP-binding protein [Gammaproteobacteria bacterium]MCY4217884.1 ABC transporter ATP-binding protein [Gammaproteobacteria bacterium]MCY4274173.1 ABC transporter ATP-binding protein [Gammaproteobacteria bacterium]